MTTEQAQRGRELLDEISRTGQGEATFRHDRTEKFNTGEQRERDLDAVRNVLNRFGDLLDAGVAKQLADVTKAGLDARLSSLNAELRAL